MQVKFTRRFILAGLGAWAAGTAHADPLATSLRPRLRQTGARQVSQPESMLSQAGTSGDVAWSVADVKTGLRLEAVNGGLALPPASVAKTLTALYALESLGSEHRFKTRIYAAGAVRNGILTGDLILAGGGDPTLDTDALAALAAQLKAAGLHEVRGDFLVYDGALPFVRSIDTGQPDHVGYSPAVSGIALNYNRVHFEWKRAASGWAISMDARTERYRPEVQMARMRVVDRKTPVYTYANNGGADSWTVASQALGNGGARWLPVRRPADYAGDVFRTLARSNGIVLKPAKVTGRLPGGAVALAERASPRLVAIVQGMLKHSHNLTAEMVGMSASAARRGGPPTSLRASAAQMSRWAARRFDMKQVSLVDHSGLGDASRVTADDLVTALIEARRQGALRPLLKAIPIRDANGRVLRNAPIKVDAKTGTLNFVSGLGGFMTAADGTELAFAIFAADRSARARISRAEREVPPGARAWNGRARAFQQKLIARWGTVYGS